jgi:hypothetical protein
LDDCAGISSAVIEQNAFGHIFNACSQDHSIKEAFYEDAALKGGYEVPQFLHELKTWKIVDSVNIKPILNYTFKVQNWKDCTY